MRAGGIRGSAGQRKATAPPAGDMPSDRKRLAERVISSSNPLCDSVTALSSGSPAGMTVSAGSLGMELRGRLEELVEIASGYQLIVGRSFQRHDVSDRRDGPGKFGRPWRAAWHGLPFAGVTQCTDAYMIDFSVASVPENSSTIRPWRETRMLSDRCRISGR